MKSDSLSKIDVLCQQLADPEADYRALPFWSWNDKLDPDELRRQIHLMKQSGCGRLLYARPQRFENRISLPRTGSTASAPASTPVMPRACSRGL